MLRTQACSLTRTKDLKIAGRKTAHLFSQTGEGCRRGRLRARIATSPWANHARLRASSAIPNYARLARVLQSVSAFSHQNPLSLTKFKNGIGSSRTAVNTITVHIKKACRPERTEARSTIRRNGQNGNGTGNTNAIIGTVKTNGVFSCLVEE